MVSVVGQGLFSNCPLRSNFKLIELGPETFTGFARK